MAESTTTHQFSSTDHTQQVVSAISHDFRGPTRQIRSFLQLLEIHLGDGLDSEAREYVDLIGSAVAALQTKLDALGRLSQVAKAEIDLLECDLGGVIEAAMAQLGQGFDDADAVLEIDAAATMTGDFSLLSTLFVELFDNALKFCARPVCVRVSAVIDRDRCLVTVSDSGPGFAAQSHNDAFDLFRRFHLDDYPGTGTGLTVARRILEGHQTAATIQSDPGTGTTIQFSLPLSAHDE